MPLGSVSPALAMFRGAPRHQILHQPGTAGFDDVYDNLYVVLAARGPYFYLDSLIDVQVKDIKEPRCGVLG